MIVTLGVRALQVLFSAVVLALSTVLVVNYGPGHAPSLFTFGAFSGAFSLIVALIGVAACFIEKLQGLPMLICDGLTTFLIAAASLAFAVKLKVGDCGDHSITGYVLNSGHRQVFWTSEDKFYPGKNGKQATAAVLDDWTSRCRMAQADTAILYFTFACTVGAVVLSFLSKRSGGGGSIV